MSGNVHTGRKGIAERAIGTAMTAANMQLFGTFTAEERKHIATFQRRAAHLRQRIEERKRTDPTFEGSYDARELRAIEYALGYMAQHAPSVPSGRADDADGNC